MTDNKGDLARGVKWSFAERMTVQGIQLVLGFVLARLLSPGDYGVVGMITVFIAVSENIVDSGFSKALIRKMDRDETDYSTAFYFNAAVGLACYAVLCALSGPIADFFSTPALRGLVKVMGLTMLINSLGVVQTARLTVAVDFRSQAIASGAAALAAGAAGVGMAWAGMGVWALAWQAVAKSAINTGMLWLMAKWRPRGRFSASSFKALFGYGSKLLAASIVNTIHGQVASIAIGRFYTAAELGNYTRGQQIATIPSYQVTGVLQRVTFPILARLQGDSAALIGAYRKYVRTSSAGIMFMSVLLAALAGPIVDVLLGPKWEGAVAFMQVYAFSAMFDHINQINMNLLQINGRAGLFLRLEAVKKCISLALLGASVPLGVMGICASRVVYGQVAVLINTWSTGRIYGLGYREQSRDFMPYLALSLACCAPAYAMGAAGLPPLAAIVAGGALAVAAYAAALRWAGDSTYDEYVRPAAAKARAAAGRALRRWRREN